ncbi:F-box/kelch-repeat protein At1g23390 [Mercurialis annua]|uniref:F-box/kelch-repeat protein At1g23390 n=1 Tax=Mercurialis annua TaxID=3986 RepID=UPI0021605151|nr:F-box/kelch-repeat protein At1g23390 [Mercurialis annua]
MSKNREADNASQEEVSINGDILESIFTNVPLIDLVSTFQVSKSWKQAVSTSLHHLNPIKPWLFLHSQSTRSPYSTAAYAFDPRSSLWIKIQEPPSSSEITSVSPLRSSHSTLLYMLSPSKFSFSFDPFHEEWRVVDAPPIWRTDPVVAVVGHRVIIAGGTCEFEDDPLAVEMYDTKTCTWDTCESMPAVFKDSAASTWLSTAVTADKMYVAEKTTAVAFQFDPETKTWYGPYNLCPYINMQSCCIGFANDRLILISLIGETDETVNEVKLFELNCESMEITREIGEMPNFLVEKMRGEVLSLSSIVVHVMGDFVFIINGSNPEEVFLCELDGHGGGCSWSSVSNGVVNDGECTLMERLVFTCAYVSLGDLYKATVIQGRRFTVL